MKRVYIFLTMVMLALMPAMMTSCDTDDWYDDYDWFNDPYNEGSDDCH